MKVMIKLSGKMREINIDEKQNKIDLLSDGLLALKNELNIGLEATEFGQYFIIVGDEDNYSIPISKENYELIRDSLELADKMFDETCLKLEERINDN